MLWNQKIFSKSKSLSIQKIVIFVIFLKILTFYDTGIFPTFPKDTFQ